MDSTTASDIDLIQYLFDLTPIEAEAARTQLFPKVGELVCCDSRGFDIEKKLAAAVELQRRVALKKMITADNPKVVGSLLQRSIGALPHEVFVCLFLDARHKVISTEEMFKGTASQTSVYPQEVVKRAMELNACAVILAHNHPSGDLTPSRADENLTLTLKSALALIDVRVLDHIIVGRDRTLSMAEQGLC